MMPRSRMEAASSSSSVSGKLRRGLRGLGRRNSIGTRRALRPPGSTFLVSSPTSPMSAARPRPNRDLPASSAMLASPELVISGFRLFSCCSYCGPSTARKGWARSALSSDPRSRDPRRNGGFGAQLFLALDDLGGEPQIGFAADAFEIVDQHRLAVGGGFRHPHIARDDGVVDLAAHELAHVRHHLVGEIVARIVHGEHDAMNGETGIERLAHLLDRLDQLRQALEREEL